MRYLTGKGLMRHEKNRPRRWRPFIACFKKAIGRAQARAELQQMLPNEAKQHPRRGNTYAAANVFTRRFPSVTSSRVIRKVAISDRPRALRYSCPAARVNHL